MEKGADYGPFFLTVIFLTVIWEPSTDSDLLTLKIY